MHTLHRININPPNQPAFRLHKHMEYEYFPKKDTSFQGVIFICQFPISLMLGDYMITMLLRNSKYNVSLPYYISKPYVYCDNTLLNCVHRYSYAKSMGSIRAIERILVNTIMGG